MESKFSENLFGNVDNLQRLSTFRFKMEIGKFATLGTRGFSRVRREFSVSAKGRHSFGRYKDLTETGNRARKVSGTQGRTSLTIYENRFVSRPFLTRSSKYAGWNAGW